MPDDYNIAQVITDALSEFARSDVRISPEHATLLGLMVAAIAELDARTGSSIAKTYTGERDIYTEADDRDAESDLDVGGASD